MSAKDPVRVFLRDLAGNRLAELELTKGSSFLDLYSEVRQHIQEYPSQRLCLLHGGLDLSAAMPGSLESILSSCDANACDDQIDVLLARCPLWTSETLSGRIFAKTLGDCLGINASGFPEMLDGLVKNDELFRKLARFLLRSDGTCALECDVKQLPSKGGSLMDVRHFAGRWCVTSDGLEMVFRGRARKSRRIERRIYAHNDGQQPDYWGKRLPTDVGDVELVGRRLSDSDAGASVSGVLRIALDALIPASSEQMPRWVPMPKHLGTYREAQLTQEQSEERQTLREAHKAYLNFAGRHFCEVPRAVFPAGSTSSGTDD